MDHAEYQAGDGDAADAVELTETDIEAMMADVWATLELPGAPAQLDPAVEGSFSAVAELQGDAENLDAQLQLQVTVDRDAAGLLVAAFFGPDGISGRAEVVDAVGELANMCAGAVKTLLPGEWVIGIPTLVAASLEHAPGWVGATVPVEAGWVRLAVGPGAGETAA